MKNWYSALFLTLTFFGFSQTKQLELALKKVYVFEKTENFTDAKSVFLQFLKEKNNTIQEINFATSYMLFYDYLLSDYSKILPVEQALKPILALLKRKPHETELVLNLFTAKYHYEASNGGWEQAIRVAEEGYKISDFSKAKLETKTDYLYDLGFLYDKTGNSFEGINFYKKSLALYIKQFGEVDNEVALNYNNLAFAYANVYNQKSTIEYYRKAAVIWEKIHKNTVDEKDYLITVYHNLIFRYIEYGDLEKTKEFGKKLNAQYSKKYGASASGTVLNTNTSYGTYVLSNIRVFLATGHFNPALEFLQKYKENIKTLDIEKNLKYLLQSYSDVIDFANENDDCKEGLNLGLEAMRVAKKYDSQGYFITFNSKIAASYICLNDTTLAVKYVALAQKSNIVTSFNSTKYTLEIQKAELLNKQDSKTLAINIVQNNIEQLVFDLSKKKKDIKEIQFKDVRELVSTDFIKLFYKSGKLYFDHYKSHKNKTDLALADKLYKISCKLFKEYYLKGEFNDELNKYHSKITEGLLEITVEKKLSSIEKTELINAIERNASQHLANEFFKKIKISTSKNTQTILAIKDLKSELNFYKNQEESTNTSAKISTIENKIAKLLNQTSATYQEIEKVSVENFDVRKVQKAVLDNEIIIKYYTLSKQVFAVSLTSKTIEIHKLGDLKTIKNQVTLFLEQAKTVNQNYVGPAKLLFKMLNLNQNFEKITIIPDGFLNFLPFETLIDPQKNEFLVQNHSISYDYSLPIWLYNKQKTTETTNTKLIAFSPNYNSKQMGQTRAGLSELKYAKEEATIISKLFKGKSFLNEKATKKQFLNSVNDFGLFHFSMHSELFQDDFNQSCLVFSNDERLYFSELYGLDFPAKLVVLSACDTGNGILKSGEGIMSLSRALTFAGVQSSVYSLWQVPDKETAEIIISFYKNLKNGQSKDEALSNAKTTFMKNNPMKNHPFYWAGFVVNGDVSAINSSINYLIYIGIGLLILILTFVFTKKLF
jgi:CHAT domain-containing protein